MKIKFKKWKCFIEKGFYSNDRVALTLIEIKSGEDVLVATVNLVNEVLTDKEIAIKDNSENEGIYKVLLEAGIISEVKRYAQSGFCQYPICDLLITEF